MWMQYVWGGGGISVCQLITLPVCLCYHHRSWSGARAAGVQYVCTDMQEAGGVSHHIWAGWRLLLSNISLFFFFNLGPQILSRRVRFPANHWLAYYRPRPMWSWKKKAQQLRSLLRTTSFYFWSGNVQCVPVRARAVGAVGAIERAAEEEECVYVYMYRCECTCPYVRAWTGSKLLCTCSPAGCCDVILPLLRCVFTPAWVTPLQLSSWGGVCAQCQMGGIWSWILSMPLPFQTHIFKEFSVSSCTLQREAGIARITVQRGSWQAAPMLNPLRGNRPLYPMQRRRTIYSVCGSLLIRESYLWGSLHGARTAITQTPVGQTCRSL